MKRQRYALVTLVPTIWLVVCTVTAGTQKVISPNPTIGFLAHAQRFSEAIAAGKVLAPAKSLGEMSRVVFNDYVDASLAAIFALIVVTMVCFGVSACLRALSEPRISAIEIGGAITGAGDD
jgi:carbon starvation protein